MKKFVILLLSVSFMTVQAQNFNIQNPQKDICAGKHLQRSANYFYAGMSLSVIAAVPLLLPDFMKNTSKEKLENLMNNYTTSEQEALSTGKHLITAEELERRRLSLQKDADSKNYRRLNYGISGFFAVSAIACYIIGIENIKLAGKKLELQSSMNVVVVAMKF